MFCMRRLRENTDFYLLYRNQGGGGAKAVRGIGSVEAAQGEEHENSTDKSRDWSWQRESR